METVTDTDVYQYAHEVIVELRGVNADGEPTVFAYHFLLDDAATVQSRSDIEKQYRAQIESLLIDAGYEIQPLEAEQ